MTVAAGLVVALFGGAGAWFLAVTFPSARFLRSSYALISLGGVAFVVWSFSKALVVGASAAIVLAIGAIVGIAGVLRKELRHTPS